MCFLSIENGVNSESYSYYYYFIIRGGNLHAWTSAHHTVVQCLQMQEENVFRGNQTWVWSLCHGDQTWVLWKGNKCPLLSHLAIPTNSSLILHQSVVSFCFFQMTYDENAFKK